MNMEETKQTLAYKMTMIRSNSRVQTDKDRHKIQNKNKAGEDGPASKGSEVFLALFKKVVNILFKYTFC